MPGSKTGIAGYFDITDSIPNAVLYLGNIANKVDGDALFAPIKTTITADAIIAVKV